MMRGLYAADSGALTRSRALGVSSNNIANMQTPGFKKDGLAAASFGAYLTYRTGANGAFIGETTHGAVVGETFTRLDQGAPEETGGAYDLAIAGEGFFTLLRPDGTTALTRNGQFKVNGNGYLCDNMGNLVLGGGGPVFVGNQEFSVGPSGEVLLGGQPSGNLRITRPADEAQLTKLEGSLYRLDGGEAAFDGRVMQGYLEASNVDMLEEMSGMIENSRAFQSCAQVIRMLDETLEKSANELGRL